MTSITITEKELELQNPDLLSDLEEEISELISDKTNYCHKGFTFKIEVKNIELDKS